MHDPGERILVTGGAGFIGSHLVERLVAETSAEIVVLDNFSGRRPTLPANGIVHPRVTICEGDIRDPAVVSAAASGASTIFHLAAQVRATSVGGPDALEDMVITNVLGTFNVLRAATNCHVGRVVFTSSSDVYGEPAILPVTEDAPLLPITTYGASKVAAEALCRAFRRESGLHTAILRLTTVYGPRDEGHVVSLWTSRAEHGEDLVVYGGKQLLDLCAVDDVVNALVRAASTEENLPPINVGSGTGTRIVDLARRISRLFGARSRPRLAPARPTDVTRFVADVQRMRDFLRLEPSLDPLAALADLTGASVAA